MLPGTFPQNFDIKTKNPDKPKVLIEYPCTMLNIEVDERCNNAQYQMLGADGNSNPNPNLNPNPNPNPSPNPNPNPNPQPGAPEAGAA